MWHATGAHTCGSVRSGGCYSLATMLWLALLVCCGIYLHYDSCLLLCWAVCCCDHLCAKRMDQAVLAGVRGNPAFRPCTALPCCLFRVFVMGWVLATSGCVRCIRMAVSLSCVWRTGRVLVWGFQVPFVSHDLQQHCGCWHSCVAPFVPMMRYRTVIELAQTCFD